ncbi:MAG: glycosyltransferase family 2 protein [Candidatus Saccharimonadales bacterium]
MTNKKSNRPRFSVVIPAFDEAKYIAGTLQSLQQQDYGGEFEVIVVDNNSSDTTAEIAKGLGAKVIHEPQAGVCFARQTGTEAARGEIVISTDADTSFSPDWLSRIDKCFQSNDKIVAVGGPCHYSNGPIWATVYPYLLFGLVSFGYKLTRRTFYASATNIAFKKSAWHGYNTLLTQGGDELDLLRNLRREGTVVFNNGNPTHTSARRLARGFIYNFIVTFLVYYLLEYYLNKLFKRRVLGSAPKFRNDFSPKVLSLLNFAVIASLVIALFVSQHNARRMLLRDSHRVINGTTKIIDRDSSL